MYNTTKPYKKEIIELIKKTQETNYVLIKNDVVMKNFSCGEFHHTDGMGTKGIYHWNQRSFKNAVIDAMAMNLNDLAMARAVPYAVIDHLFLPKDDKEAILEIVNYLAEECQKRSIAITGGETAIHDNMEGLEISIAMLGFVKNPKPNLFKVGDVLVGIESNGLHSNGFTKVREIFGKKYKQEFIAPTAIYSDAIFNLNEKVDIHGMMHITGGAFTKLKDLLIGADAIINDSHKLEPQEIFLELYKKGGISDKEIYQTFNCGIGFVLGVDKNEADKCINEMGNFKADIIGEVIDGKGNVKILSKFSNKKIKY